MQVQHFWRLVLGISSAIAIFVVAGCAVVEGAGNAELVPLRKPQYARVFEAAVKACRELNLPINQANKDIGEIQCGLKSSQATFAGVGYSVDTFIERGARDSVKDVSVKVGSRSGAYWGVATDADANKFAQRYVAILRRNGVR